VHVNGSIDGSKTHKGAQQELAGHEAVTADGNGHKERHRVNSRTVAALLVVEKRRHLCFPF